MDRRMIGASANILAASAIAAMHAPRVIAGAELEALDKQRQAARKAAVVPVATQAAVDTVRAPVLAAARKAVEAGGSMRNALEAAKALRPGKAGHGIGYTAHQGSREMARRRKRVQQKAPA